MAGASITFDSLYPYRYDTLAAMIASDSTATPSGTLVLALDTGVFMFDATIKTVPSGGYAATDNGGVYSASTINVLYLNDSNNLTSFNDSALNSLPSGDIFVGNVSGVATAVAMSGDATLSNTGALTIASSAVTTAKIANSNVTLAKLAAGITPVVIPVFAGNHTVASGGTTTESWTVNGVQTTDILIATYRLCLGGTLAFKAVPSINTITVNTSDNTTTGDVFAYVVYRAAS